MLTSSRLFLLLSVLILVAGLVQIARVDLNERLDTDVGSLIPEDESPEAGILRSLIGDRQGRLVYFSIAAPALSPEQQKALRSRVEALWRNSPVVSAVGSARGAAALDGVEALAQRRLELLFPRWLAAKREARELEGEDFESFAAKAAEAAVDDLDLFLESPAALELARPELIDPLLLTIGALEALAGASGGGNGGGIPAGSDTELLYWAELAASPLATEAQDTVERLVLATTESARSMDAAAQVSWGGLVRLAQASRERIRSDVTRVNLFSLLAVLGVAAVLARPVWRALGAVPVIALALFGAVGGSLLVFPKIHVIVLIIGSILIGTSVDYAFHTLFAKPAKVGFPTRKLLFFACLSTVIGFGILLVSEMALIRQVGAFVAFGLLSAFVASQALPNLKPAEGAGARLERMRLPPHSFVALCTAMAVVVVGRAITWPDTIWEDDIRKLEAPNPRVVAEDLALRSRFAAVPEGQVALSVGGSYLEALDQQARLLEAVPEAIRAKAGFAPGLVLPRLGDVEALLSAKERLPRFFAELKEALNKRGYDVAVFDDFFQEAAALTEGLEQAVFEDALRSLSEHLAGPSSALLNSAGQWHWTAMALPMETEAFRDALAGLDGSFALSQLAMLNDRLGALRARLAEFGGMAMALVAATLLAGFGFRRGLAAVAIPCASVLFAMCAASWLAGPLTLFHLVGCFLGSAIALDYALFGLEARSRRESLPYSVWLSAATTGASFLALATSYIVAVRALGLIVALITLTTLAILVSLQSKIRPIPPNESSA